MTLDPTAEEIAELAILSAANMQRMDVEPRAALVSHSNFGDRRSPSAVKMRKAAEILRNRNVDFEVDGEIHADVALSNTLRPRALEY